MGTLSVSIEKGEIMMSERTEKKNTYGGFLARYLTKKVVAVILLLALLGAVGTIGVKTFFYSEPKTTKLGFEDIGELATQAVYSTQVNVTEASLELFGVTIPFTQSKYIYSYDVVIKAGFDFGEIEWEVNDTTILVRLPQAKILSSQLEPESFKIYHESESVFRPITLDENNAALIELKQNAERDAIANGLLDNARSNAELILKGFFAGAYDMETYTVKFVSK